MAQAPLIPRPGPPLRISAIEINNYRTFRGPVTIPLRSDQGVDRIATFHGDNGVGKSNALAALDLFFAVLGAWLRTAPATAEDMLLSLDTNTTVPQDIRPIRISSRDRPIGMRETTKLGVYFVDLQCALGLIIIPSGQQVRVKLRWTPDIHTNESTPTKELRDQLATWLYTPLGPGSQPLAIINARRHASWLGSPEGPRLLQPALAEKLFQLRTSMEPRQRERWRQFTKLLEVFPTFAGKEVSIERVEKNASPVLIIEERGKLVLPLDELSSGEQQLLVLCSAILLADAAIVAIEEPELSLDLKNQRLLLDILEQQVEAGLVDQVILESHVPTFDGPQVVRFSKGPAGETLVSREAGASAALAELRHKAQEQGAAQRWVTRDGFTQLPQAMQQDLHTGSGAHVWFLKGQERWEAWPEEELERLLAPASEEPPPGEEA